MSITLHPVLAAVTERIRQRSAKTRGDYLAMVEQAGKVGPQRKGMGCANLAHAFAASPASDISTLKVRVDVRGSNTSGRSSEDCSSSIACRMGSAIRTASAVGSIPRLVRANSGSPIARRRRDMALLMAGWLMPSRSAARVTFFSAYTAANTRNRLRSSVEIFILESMHLSDIH